jgi:hypothetical protein
MRTIWKGNDGSEGIVEKVKVNEEERKGRWRLRNKIKLLLSFTTLAPLRSVFQTKYVLSPAGLVWKIEVKASNL